jgi:hypothetical protein
LAPVAFDRASFKKTDAALRRRHHRFNEAA